MLFSEVYGTYYNVLAELLQHAVRGELTREKMQAVIREKGFEESILTIPDALESGTWPLLNRNLTTPLEHAPTMPLTELQKRWEKEQGLADEEEENKPEPPKKKDKEKAEPKEGSEKPAPPPKDEAKKPDPPPKVEEKKPVPLPKDWDGRIAQAMADLRAQDYAAADVLLESLLKERPKDLNALLLRAAAQAGTQNYYAAQRTLERAMRAHPRSYLPYYNLANLLLIQGGDLESAREYYELGRTVGGPVNKALEARLKGVGK